ncbi:MAG: hypothetical protein A3H96_23650 [Acidobacteria bacterium RIFCSPLOWO2_02_FULL_67_36]|nr:MAG: hypothetical protein A3H96_23650 [Acidobacteria bacterium RIFCSPLOWO2_02_FULL_67_36]
MQPFKRVARMCRTLFRARELDRDLDEELRAYVDDRIAARVAGGASPAEARRLVLAEEGGFESIKEDTRDTRAGFGVATLAQDLRYGWRTLRRSPGYAAVACLVLGLGIGANVAMFTVMRSVLWRPLPYPAPDRLVVLEADVQGVRNAGPSSREVHDLRIRSRALTELAVVNGVDAHVEIHGEIERVAAASVSADLLPALGVRPALGRLFDPRDGSVNGQVRRVIISDALWRRRLGADPAAVGSWITVNNTPREVIGVLPPDFPVFLPASTGVQEETHVWFPTGIAETSDARGEGVIGRLAGHASLADAQREIDLLAAQFAAERPTVYRDAVRFRLAGMREAVAGNVDAGLRALGLAVAFVLLVSCVNVANLTLARASGRVRELAVRRALGAGRGRIVRQLLTESLLLSVIGGGIGLLLGHWGVQLLEWLRPTHLPRQSEVGMDATIALFSVAISLAAGVLFGIVPAFRFGGADAQALRAGRADSPARGSRRLQRALVVVEIALSIVPLVAAGLMRRSFVNLSRAPLGFNPDRVVTAWMPVSFRQFPDVQARWRLHADVLARVRAVPGVEAASAGSPPPFHQLQFTRRYGRSGEATRAGRATQQTVTPGYFSVMGTKLVAGRDVTADDIVQRRPVVIVDARIARELWPRDAIGQRLAIQSGQRVTDLEVIGVTEPVRVKDIRDAGLPTLFVPYHLFAIEMALVIETDLPATALEPVLRTIVQEAGTGRAVFDVWPLAVYVERSMADTRFIMLVLTAFAVVSLLLAGIGLYGTLTYLTMRRSREFGVRLALGASGWQILALVAREGLVLTAVGTVAGMLGALAAARAIRGLLYGVDAIDAGTLVSVAALVGVLSIASCLKPAWAAGRTDPTTALRAE